MRRAGRRTFMKAMAATPLLTSRLSANASEKPVKLYGDGLGLSAAELFSALNRESAFDIETIPNGSNLFKLIVRGTDLETFRERLRAKGVWLSRPRTEIGGFLVGVNATLNRTDAATLAEKIKESV